MKMKVVRTYGDASSTNGTLYVHGIPFCETMESPKHGSIFNRCIAPGEYKLVMVVNEFSSFSPKLVKAERFKDIGIRPGENCREAHGNILVGEICTGDNHQLVGGRAIFARLVDTIKEAYAYGDRRFTLVIEESPDFEYVENAECYVSRQKGGEYGDCH